MSLIPASISALPYWFGTAAIPQPPAIGNRHHDQDLVGSRSIAPGVSRLRHAFISQGESGDEILQLLLGRLDLGGALRDGRGQSADRRFGFTELIEGLLVQRRIMSDRGEIVSQPLFVLNELATLLFQLVELGVLPRERLPPRSELSKCFFHRRFEFVCRNKHA